MAESKSNAATQTELSFTNCKNNVVLKPKVTPKVAYVYRNVNTDLKGLIDFVKSEPKAKIVDGKLTLCYGKFNLFENSVILISEVGKVSEVISFDEANKRFDIQISK